MFAYIDGPQAKQECRPDPEQILEGIRKERSTLANAESLLLEFVSLPVHFSTMQAEQSIAQLLGELQVKKLHLTRRENELLEQIDREAK